MADGTTGTDTDTGRRTFGPVVLLGLASAGLAAVAGHQRMLEVPEDGLGSAETLANAQFGDATYVEFPLAGALALVVLACWGVLLVTRGRLRRVVAGLATVAAAGGGVVVVVGGFLQQDEAAADLAERLGSPLAERLPLDLTAWFWAALAGTLLSVVAGALATMLVPSWPQMGSRYDAPTTRTDATQQPAAPPEERTSLDLWKSLDEGDDPTDR